MDTRKPESIPSPFDDALKILAKIIAEKHLASLQLKSHRSKENDTNLQTDDNDAGNEEKDDQ